MRHAVALDDVLREGALHCVYQPFVDVDTGTVLAFEALLRGPAGTGLQSPLALLDAARTTGRLADLERASLRASLRDAADMSQGRPVTLFVNLEPTTLTQRLDVVLEALAARAGHVQVVVEITERALAEDLAAVLTGAEQLRAAGCAIALDDVGVHPESLAFIPLLRPEVVKLDLKLLRTVKDPATVAVAGAVRAYAEQAGAEVVAEGIETPDDLTRALVLGATLGQGWLWSRGERRFPPSTFRPERFTARPIGAALRATPFELVGAGHRIRHAPKHLLVPLSKTLELMALHASVSPVLLAAFEHARFFRPATSRRFTTLAAHLPFVAALGVDITSEPAPGVRGGHLTADDPLSSEWTVVVLGAHTAAALIARDLGDTGTDADRQFAFAVTYDRALVTAAAHSMVGRLTRN
ncbi:EAL domain-containing protein (putative c-di-GMP-specific phosphodiesterase class I) [Actinoplanes lutulentus]|uniref:EAL domain-containing protein (Putative c-di-GMP-specific phosphodiesterase class I) n=2 Tax=Actinoplanes lutulentus TaxID=1287878 RepID=A0A327YX66_9ACTN|nr:EAL domain-containing protein (putative c-di-GMP-specific phosphodiesterase class I) [Actinoplanes lutulentus]